MQLGFGALFTAVTLWAFRHEMGNHADMYRRSSVCFAAVWGSRSQRIPVGTAIGLGRHLFRELVPHFALEFSTTGLGGSASPLLEEECNAR